MSAIALGGPLMPTLRGRWTTRQVAAWPPSALPRALLGIPLLVVGTLIAISIVNRKPLPAVSPQIELRSADGGQTTALVFGAGSGIHLVRTSTLPTSLRADLARGPLRVVALGDVQLLAAGFPDRNVLRLEAKGPIVQLRRDGGRVSVRTGF